MLRLCMFTVLALLSLVSPLAAGERPNVIAIVTDDQARWAVGAYGNDDVRTPHLDSLAREGAIFTRAFAVTPVCSPSRAAYMTGRWPTEIGITDYLSKEEQENGLGMVAQTWPAVLKANGYRTALVGKWHLGDKPEHHPTRMGFDHFVGFAGGGAKPMDSPLEVDGKIVQSDGPLADVLTDHAIEFIGQDRERPFALCLHFREPHLPYGPVAEVDAAPYRDLDPKVPDLPALDVEKVKQAHRDYYASISSVDRNLGRLLKVLDERGLADNTLVVFTSDHGYNEGRHYVTTKGNGRWLAGGVPGPTRPNMWDTSLMVPLVMRWPKVVKPGTKIDAMFSNLDTFRTMLGAMDVPVPQDCDAHGIDFSPLLRGEPFTPPTEVFGQYDLHHYGLAYLRMIRTDDWKFVRHFRSEELNELYDLKSDPDETNNLLRTTSLKAKNAAIAEPLKARLLEWQKSIDDPVLRAPY